MKSIRSAETEMVEMHLDQCGVVLVVEKRPTLRHDADSMRADVAAFRTLTGGEMLPVVWDVRQMDRPTADGWQALVNELPDAVAAMAVLVDAESRPIAGSFPEVMNSFLFPSRVFEDLKEAFEWAERFVPAHYESNDA